MTYTVYKTVNQVNGKFYIGVHKTNNPMDEYLGSGTVIQLAIQKYGVLSFVKEILFKYETQEEAWVKENELVELHRADPLCYNLRKGGSGGYDYINSIGRNTVGVSKGGIAAKLKRSNDPKVMTRFKQVTHQGRKQSQAFQSHCAKRSELGAVKWRGQHHSIESRSLMSSQTAGSRNSQFGTCWISLRGVERKIKVEHLPDYLKLGWLKGRKYDPVL